MSVASEITRINNNIANAYTQVNAKGGTLPATQNSNNLATAINSIPTGGSSETFEYNNWISYGTTTPSASDYKYWLPVNTTPLSTPLKYVKNYKIGDYFTGDLGALADETTGMEYKSQSALSIFGIKADGYNNYFYSSAGQGATPSNITIYKYTYNSSTTPLPGFDIGNTSKMTSLGTLATLFNLSSNTIYGCWTAYNNTIYGCFGNSILAYNVGTSTLSTWASSSTTLLSSSYRALGLIRRSSTQMLLYRTNSSGTSIEVLSISNTGSVSTVATKTGLSNMTSYNALQITTTQALIMYKSTSWSMTSTTQNKLYYCSTSSITERTYPFNTGTMSARYLAPENTPIFTFSADPYEIYRASDTGIVTYSSWGNLGLAVVKASIGSIGYLSGFTVKACVPANNFSIKDTNDVIHTANFNSGNDYSYNLLSFSRNTNYEITTETIESENSSNNVLLISNYKDSVPTQSYAFKPTSTSEIFLWLYRYNDEIKFIYNQTEYTMQVSVNDSWVTNDTANNIL